MRILMVLSLVCLPILTAQRAFAVDFEKECARLLDEDAVIDWVTTTDPMFRRYNIAEQNRLDGVFCVAKGVIKYLTYLGREPNPDHILGTVCGRARGNLIDLARDGLDDEGMRLLFRKSIHQISDDEGYDDGYVARGTVTASTARDRAITRRDLEDSNREKYVVLLKLHRWTGENLVTDGTRIDLDLTADARWVVLRRVVDGAGPRDAVVVQIEDPRSHVLITGLLEPVASDVLGFGTWSFTADGDRGSLTVVSGLLSSSLGFDEE